MAKAGKLGRIIQRKRAGDEVSYQVEVWDDGTRHRIGSAPIGGHWTPIRSRELAEMVLNAIRTTVAEGASVGLAVAPFLRKPTQETLVLTKADRWLDRERERCQTGDISPTTLREYERYAVREFQYWQDRHIWSIRYGDLEDWRSWLGRGDASAGRGPLAPKTVQNILGAFRVMLRWLYRRGDLPVMPDFPEVPQNSYAPTIISITDQDAILEAIPWQKRGVFYAMAHTLRPGEARALEFRDYRDGDLLVKRAVKGTQPHAPVRTAKERNWRVVGCDDRLVAWIEWRRGQVSKRDWLEGVGRLFVNPHARDPLKRWGQDAAEKTWKRSCDKVGVPVSLYEGTKHATATDLLRRGEDMELVRKFLGHADRRSTERYARLADRQVSDAMRRRDRQT